MPTPFESAGLRTLRLCLHRLHGRRVDSTAVRIPDEGLVLGSDSVPTSQYGTLHVVPHHAVVRAHAGHWVLEPGCRDMVVALNGEKIPWGDRRPLNPGDRIDIGFASLLVDAHDVAVTESVSMLTTSPVKPDAVEQTTFSLQLAVPGESSVSPEALPETSAAPAVPAANTSSPAEELCALLAEDARNSAGCDSMHYTSGSLESLLHNVPETSTPPPEIPTDALSVLTAESARVLAGKSPLPDSRSSIPILATPETSETQLPDQNPFSDTPAAASLEAILEGPITIDDVLESLKRRHPLAPENPWVSADGTRDPLTSPELVPDPLLLLAGVEVLPVREPELAPVLHREHRATGINTPYGFGSSQHALKEQERQLATPAEAGDWYDQKTGSAPQD